ncbi:MEDS domain-containing protein [Dactylosporangium aurantiacum]|uniref:MEDS domain-containing protein n=1 Tax=Dactylosporangium aurantiacum TaxID=35754 RepID=A0A9Q9MIU8_9ACTN|nr:MEDS domain-containing protein [Dactylosporangium aurantiacum]MDG6109562.1 MEDS domain-containing protein [Dactylosporangium aurantiacum]UWZ51282.1 MEDS domain-containing protein [Dactylosporangium aurantiacum]
MAQADTVGQVATGDHACLTFSDPDERLDLLAAFVAEGLDAGHKVMCYTDAVAPADLTGAFVQRSVDCPPALHRQQLQIAGTESSWLAGGALSAAKMIDLLAREVDRAARDGYAGLRVTADMSWAARPLAAAEELIAFETGVATLFADGRLTAICQYDRDVFDPVTLAFAAKTHDRAVAAQVYHEDALLRICRQYRPPGVRAAGELDFRHLEPLQQAVSEAVRLDQHPEINLRRLRYIDAAAASVIVRAALSLPDGRVMTVLASPLVAKVLALSGTVDATTLRVVVAP